MKEPIPHILQAPGYVFHGIYNGPEELAYPVTHHFGLLGNSFNLRQSTLVNLTQLEEAMS